MKRIILSVSLLALMASCSGNDSGTPVNQQPHAAQATQNPANPEGGENKVLMLKVDLTTYVFEGGKEFTFDAASTFTIGYEYMPPGDFGSIALYYSELEQPLFDGTIVWAGLGEMSFPSALDAPESFTITEDGVIQPELSGFETIEYTEGGIGEGPDHQSIWAAIDNLQLVKEYREANPDAKVSLFLYTPSVGIGDPAEWDWFVILKN